MSYKATTLKFKPDAKAMLKIQAIKEGMDMQDLLDKIVRQYCLNKKDR